MELQCCGEFEAGSRKCKLKDLTIQKYLDFCELHKHSDLTVNQLKKIISIHGFKILHQVRKEVLIDAVDSIELMDLTRSTINDDSVSSYAFITSEEAIKDLMCLNWIECSVTSFKTFNSVNYDLISLQNVNDVALKSKTMKKKPPKMSRLKDVAEPACSLASGDQCSAKGNTGDCAAADPLSLSSLLTTKKNPPKTRRLENIVKPACSLASGDQCSAKGNISDSAASDDLSLSSFLTTKKKLSKMRRLENRVKPACSLASGDQCSAKGSIGDSAASDYLSLSSFLPESGEERPNQKRHKPGRLEGRIFEFQKKKEKQQSVK